jgi:hypothetical protein
MKPFLNVVEIKALLKRHQVLLKHVARMIAERGELQVLINLNRTSDGQPTPAAP